MTSPSPAAHAVPTRTGTTLAGNVRGRAPATHRFTNGPATCGPQPGPPIGSRGDGTVLAVPDLVALALPGGPAFMDALQRAWDAGHAVAPLDLRLAPPARAAVLDALAPAIVVAADGTHRRPGGQPVE